MALLLFLSCFLYFLQTTLLGACVFGSLRTLPLLYWNRPLAAMFVRPRTESDRDRPLAQTRFARASLFYVGIATLRCPSGTRDGLNSNDRTIGHRRWASKQAFRERGDVQPSSHPRTICCLEASCFDAIKFLQKELAQPSLRQSHQGKSLVMNRAGSPVVQ